MAAKKKAETKSSGSDREAQDQVVRVEVIANLFGVTVRRVQQITQEGIIQTVPAKDENGRACRRYDLIPTVKSYIQHLSDKANGKAQKTDREMELRAQKIEADIALRESQGELHRIKTSIAAGEYISIEEVRLDYAKFFTVFKKFAMSLPTRVSGMLAGDLDPLKERKIEKEISREISDLLKSFVIAGIVQPKDVKGILSGGDAQNP